MYLEPIFSSEDIMRQMPTEARNFRDVDKEWRTIMGATQKQPMVLEATDFPGLLKKLKFNNALLDDIQRGLNDYLEKKRLFFPRSGFFFGNSFSVIIFCYVQNGCIIGMLLAKRNKGLC